MEISQIMIPILIAEIGFLLYAYFVSLTMLCVTLANIFLISFFGAMTLTAGSLSSNIGNLFFPFVLLSQFITLRKNGKHVALNNVWIVTGAIIFFSAITSLMGKDVPPSSIAAGSLCAFIVGQFFFVWFADKFKSVWMAYGINMIITEILDSLIFFPIAFSNLPLRTVLFMAISGLVIKSILGISLIPLAYFLGKKGKTKLAELKEKKYQ